MASNNRVTCFDARLLRGLVGTTVTTYDLVSDGASLQSTSLAPSTEPSRATTSPTTPSTLVLRLAGKREKGNGLNSLSAGREREKKEEARGLGTNYTWGSGRMPYTTASPMTVVSTSSAVSRTWVITKKLSERAAPMTDYDIKMGRSSAKTVGKFLCHLAGDPHQMAFMRIYQHIPITGTEDADYDTLARQAVAPGVCGELEAFKMLQSGGCGAVPRFLGHAESTQGDSDLLPGGYIRYLVWERVPGEPLTKELFWSLDRTARNDIRAKFRDAYE
ncbi:unnamed protein product [Penicillium salamii]|nr:unnamed protein product [Penicillium salamii]